MFKKSFALVLAVSLGVSLIGCSKEAAPKKETGNTPAVSTEPVTLKVMPRTTLTDADIQKLYIEPVKKKYPHITLEIIKAQNNFADFSKRVTAGDLPDISADWAGLLPDYEKLGALEDLNPLIKKFGYDTKRFDSVILDSIAAASDKGELFGLPYSVNFNATFYNKDIFDKFGVPYPKDGMTWDDAIQLGKQLTRNEGGVQYRGLDPESVVRLTLPLSNRLIDLKTNKAAVNNDQWKKVFDLADQIYSIPGNAPKKLNNQGEALNAFAKDKVLAMYPSVNILSRIETAVKENNLNWDLVQYPSYKERPNTYGMSIDADINFITKTSKHKEAAFLVLQLITSDETQLTMTRTMGRVSPLKNEEIKKQFGAETPLLKGKNVQGIFKSQPAPVSGFYYQPVPARDALFKAYDNHFLNGKDTNTALRELEENINKYLEQEKK